ncbi:hypothetical protein WA026_019211 [Henosepilachna vigintioctopunctata]|uniref:Uncharacterized protein n=1 Tax=Henosepilachna vigintioctopunctata TaxID=420089 RepID=A0AAW1UUY8_9CUCU
MKKQVSTILPSFLYNASKSEGKFQLQGIISLRLLNNVRNRIDSDLSQKLASQTIIFVLFSPAVIAANNVAPGGAVSRLAERLPDNLNGKFPPPRAHPAQLVYLSNVLLPSIKRTIRVQRGQQLFLPGCDGAFTSSTWVLWVSGPDGSSRSFNGSYKFSKRSDVRVPKCGEVAVAAKLTTKIWIYV